MRKYNRRQCFLQWVWSRGDVREWFGRSMWPHQRLRLPISIYNIQTALNLLIVKVSMYTGSWKILYWLGMSIFHWFDRSSTLFAHSAVLHGAVSVAFKRWRSSRHQAPPLAGSNKTAPSSSPGSPFRMLMERLCWRSRDLAGNASGVILNFRYCLLLVTWQVYDTRVWPLLGALLNKHQW